jgi:hypothetical protein
MATTNQMPKTISDSRPRRGQPLVPVQVLAMPTVLPYARGVQLPRAGSLAVREVNRNRGTRTSASRGSHVALRTRSRTVVT